MQIVKMEIQENTQLCQLPSRLRSDYSNKFKGISISSNHYHVNIANFDSIYVFKIKITPKIMFDNSKLRNIIIGKAIPDVCKFIKNPVVSGMTIYSLQKPLENQRELKVQDEGIEYDISIKLVKQFDVKEKPKVLIQFLNNGLRNIMKKLDYVEIGRTNKFFDIKNKTNVDSLVMYSGFKSNFVFLQKGIFLRVDTAKKIVRKDTVLMIIDQLYRIHGDKDRDQKREIVRNELISKIVMTNYGKTRYFRINDVIYKEMGQVMLQDNQNIEEYYKTKYQIQFKKKQPLLEVECKNKKDLTKTYLIPQLCLMTGIPDNFDDFRRKKISDVTIKNACDRKKEIHKLINEIKGTTQIQGFSKLGIKVNPEMQTIDAKVIPPPRISLGGQNSIENGKESFFNLYAKPIYSNKHAIKLGIVYFEGVDIRGMIDCFESTCKNLQVDLQIKKLKGGELEIRKAMLAIQSLIKQAAEKQCNVCLVVLPNQLRMQYNKIKANSLLDRKIICQILVDSTLRKKNVQSILTKVLLQIIAKRGNTLWVPKSKFKFQKIMICAIESCKGPQGTIYLSLCATLNSTFTSIFSRTTIFDQNIQRFQPMNELFLKAVDAYLLRNKQLPNDIILFHNSCSFDQISLYRDHFIKPALARMDEIYKEARPLLSFITVNTKTDQRLFSDSTGYETSKNVPAGTIVAKDIVSANYDFYMVSQYTQRGSTVPNHYEVIYSDSKMEEGVLQELIYAQCFNYVNWTGSIKIPGILQYAKKCVKFNSQVLEGRTVSEDLQGKLYFI